MKFSIRRGFSGFYIVSMFFVLNSQYFNMHVSTVDIQLLWMTWNIELNINTHIRKSHIEPSKDILVAADWTKKRLLFQKHLARWLELSMVNR